MCQTTNAAGMASMCGGTWRAVALMFLSMLLPIAGFALIAAAGLPIVVCGVVLAADVRDAMSRYLRSRLYGRDIWSRESLVRLQGVGPAVIGAVGLVGSVASLIVGGTYQ